MEGRRCTISALVALAFLWAGLGVGRAAEGPASAPPPTDDDGPSEVGLLLGLGMDGELTYSCAVQEEIGTGSALGNCSPLLFRRAEVGLSLRILRQAEVALAATYGVPGERDFATHDLFKLAASFRYFMTLGSFQPSVALFAGMALASDDPVGPGETERQFAPMVGIELPVGARLDSVAFWLVPSFFAAPFPRQELGTTVARDHLPWWAGLGLRGAYYLPL